MADRPRFNSPLSIFIFLLLFIHGHSFGIGVSPHNFYKGDILEVKANKLASTKTNVAYSYYSVPYCRPYTIADDAQNLEEILRGYRVQDSPYKFRMRVTTMCNIVCRVKLNKNTAKEFKEKIDDEYRANMILDNLPLVTKMGHDSTPVYQLGYFVGGKVRYENTTDEKYYINNHLSFIVRFHQNIETPSARIVGFEVEASSINHKYIYDGQWSYKPRLTTCDQRAIRLVTGSDPPQEVDDQKEIIFTYDVEFRESNVKWASRWDTYLLTSDDQIHWFSVLNSLMIVLSISGTVALIMLRTLYRDIFEYDQLETLEEAQEETGWKLVHTDVFRPPVNSGSLCVLVGTGVQLSGTVVLTIIFAIFGILSPAYYQTGLITVIVYIWALMGIFGGLATARLYKSLEGSEWNMKTTLATACLFPGTIFCILVLNALTRGEESWGTIRFDTMSGWLFIWLGISVPLVFAGSYVSFTQPGIKESVKTSKIPREIPKQSWYMSSFLTVMIGGILPFGVVYNELFFMLTSTGLYQYYMFGLVCVILIMTCAKVTILLCYVQLCREDYQWWWRSYLTAGSSAFYLFMYATFHFFTKLNITELAPGVFYFGYMLIASFTLFMLTGTIGFYACLWFIRRIYSSLVIA